MTTAQVVLTLGVALIAAAAGIGGSVLAPLLNADRAHRQWLRDKRADLCERFYAALIAAREDAALGRVEPAPATPGHYLPSPESQAAMARLRDAASALSLYASTDLADDAMRLWGDYQAVVLSRLFPDKPARVQDFQGRFAEHAESVLAKIRAELGAR